MDRDTVTPFSSVEALRFGWAKTRDNLRPFVLLGVFAGFLSLLQQGLSGPSVQSGLRPVLGFVLQLVQLAVTMLMLQFALRAHDDKPLLPAPVSGDMASRYFSFALTTALVGLVVLCGFVLLIVPGVIWLLRYCFATLLVLDQDLDPLAALRTSAKVTHGFKLHLLGFGMLMLVVNMVGALSFGIGLLVTVPTTFVASVYALRHLQALHADEHAQTDLATAPLASHRAA